MSVNFCEKIVEWLESYFQQDSIAKEILLKYKGKILRYKEFISYCTLGVVGVAVDLALYSIFVFLFGMHYQVASTMSISLGLLTNFSLNYHFNFSIKGDFWKRFLSFYWIGMLGCVITAAILFFLISYGGFRRFIAKAIAVIIVTMLQFWVNRYMTFSEHGIVSIFRILGEKKMKLRLMLRNISRVFGSFELGFLLLFSIFIALFIQGCLFFIGKSCSPYPVWIGIILSSILAFAGGKKKLLCFWILVLIVFLLTMYTFSYYGPDSINYHLPMQRLLHDGWNPVFDSTLEKIGKLLEGEDVFIYHTLFLPKTTALCGAMVALSTGLWVGDAYLGYALLFCLFQVSFFFCKKVWNCPAYACVVFSSSLTFSTKITSFLSGQVDYTVYAALMISILSLYLYIQEHDWKSLALSVISTIICSTCKTTGLVCCVCVWMCALFYIWQRKNVWIAVLLMAVSILVIGASPLLTAWIQYGSPLYPSHSFSSVIQPVDITSDFTANDDGMSMGYISRITYAWISQDLALKACAFIRGKESFFPVFYVCAGCGGIGTWFRILMCFSLCALVLARKDKITLLCCLLFVISNFAPLKYIGYNRYFPQIWSIVPIAFFQVTYRPIEILQKLKVQKICKCGVMFCVGMLAFLSLMRAWAFQCRNMIFESYRQALVSEMKCAVCFLPEQASITLRERLKCAGVVVTNKEHEGKAFPIIPADFLSDTKMFSMDFNEIKHSYYVCDSVHSLVVYPWLDVLYHFPKPLFDK